VGKRESQQQSVALVFSGLILVMLVAALDSTIVSTALPTIARDLGGLQHITWVTTAYLLAQTVVTPVYGKLGDLYGRKLVLQIAVVIFLIGSALCGAANGMTELIVFRGIQGLGGGGLMVLSQAAIGDVVAPSERGRYSGVFGAVFGVATIAGPLLGGFLTGSISWRWIFYVNLPVGALAIVVLARTLPSGVREQRRIDVLGTLTLGGALTALILATSLGGTSYAWGSAFIVAMFAACIVLLAAFIFVEGRAAEPIIPLSLFKNAVVRTTSIVGFVVGFAMFGAVTFLPLFLQVVNGASPTGSGLQMLPMMLGLLVTSIGAGQIVTRWGHYKPFPIIGTAVMALGLYLLSTMDAQTSRLTQIVFMAVVGLGLGMVMQILVLAVQNAVDYTQLGVATSSATLFRSIGGSLGVSILGAVFTSRLPDASHADPAAFTDALDQVFLIGAFGAIPAFVAAWLIPERPLRQTVTTTDTSHAFAAPKEADSLRELTRALGVLLGRDGVKAMIERTAQEAGVDLPAAAVAALARIDDDPGVDLAAIERERGLPDGVLVAGEQTLRDRGYLAADSRELTPEGAEVLARFLEVRRRRLGELLDGWAPEQHGQLTELLRRVAREVEVKGPAQPVG
jgi:EmrB/QacA subfamily drug resistance transporter